MKTPPSDVDLYFESFPLATQERLKTMRQLILENASEAKEYISYGMPAYKLHGHVLVYFAGYKKHIGLYATPSGHAEFKEALSAYKQGKGSVQFPLDKERPVDLIAQLIQFKIFEISTKNK